MSSPTRSSLAKPLLASNPVADPNSISLPPESGSVQQTPPQRQHYQWMMVRVSPGSISLPPSDSAQQIPKGPSAVASVSATNRSSSSSISSAAASIRMDDDNDKHLLCQSSESSESVVELTISSLRQRIAYISLLVLSILALVLCVVSTATSAIMSTSTTFAQSTTVTITLGYWRFCIETDPLQASVCVNYVDQKSIPQLSDSLRASQALAILSVVVTAITAFIIVLLPIRRLQQRSRELLYATAALSTLALACTLIAFIMFVVRYWQPSDKYVNDFPVAVALWSARLEYGGVMTVLAVVLQLAIAGSCLVLAVKRITFDKRVWTCGR